MHASTMTGHLVRRLHQISTMVFNNAIHQAGYDLTSVQFAAMDAIRANPGIDQAGVAAMIAYDRATIGGVIDRLERKGLVLRTVSRRDKRAREVRLSKTGQQVFDILLPVVQALQADILPGLTEDERRQFLALASKSMQNPTKSETD